MAKDFDYVMRSHHDEPYELAKKANEESSLYMDCNGKLWYFKKFADTEKEEGTKISLFSYPNLYKLERHLKDIVTEGKKRN